MIEVTGGLGRLIETESRIAEALGAAEVEAGRLLHAAREAGDREEADFQASVEAAVAELAGRLAAERDAEVRRVAAEGAERARRFRQLPDAIIEELAAGVARRVLIGEGSGAGP
ncbi:MAG TPA: hypothetical protein VG500_19170 [Gemmatimonadales bacterium]|jgi:hypothetical protein|nr:hypothetical protein [Gemmatimonadales bacterium]